MPLLPYATAVVALGMLALSSSHFAAVGLRAARANARARGVRLRRQADLCRQSQHVRLASELSWQNATETANAWRVVEVIEIVDESADCRSFYLRDPLGGDLPEFQPGQFIMVRPALGGASQPTRCYSLSDAPAQPWWRITVKRQSSLAAGAGPQARCSLSAWLHERIAVGDCLLVSGPRGEFVLDDCPPGPIVLLAAGVGITPLISMLKHSLRSDATRPVHLFFQVADDQHWPLGEVVHSWQQSCSALAVTSYFSRQMPSPAPSHGRALPGKFAAADVVKRSGKHSNTTYYLCGPEGWMRSLVEGLTSLGVASERIHFESFGTALNNSTAADRGGNSSGPAPVDRWSLKFARSGVQLESGSQPATIWEAAAASGLQLPAGCHSGACGSCRLKLLGGQVNYRVAPQCSVAEGEVLACIAQPIGDVVVDA
jgi:ferredoxin-NADP reductase